MLSRCAPAGTDVQTCESQVERLERGAPLPDMTLAESIAHVTSLAVAQEWQAPQDRERARGLVLRLAALGWRDAA